MEDEEEKELPERPVRPTYSIDVASLPTISMEEVCKHNVKEDCWTVVDGLVYNVTLYVPYHPGGKRILQGAGREASQTFRKSLQEINRTYVN